MIITKQHLILIGVMLLVVAIGLFILNQFIEFQFKVELLSTPCQLCERAGNKCVRVFPINFST